MVSKPKATNKAYAHNCDIRYFGVIANIHEMGSDFDEFSVKIDIQSSTWIHRHLHAQKYKIRNWRDPLQLFCSKSMNILFWMLTTVLALFLVTFRPQQREIIHRVIADALRAPCKEGYENDTLPTSWIQNCLGLTIIKQRYNGVTLLMILSVF